MKYADGRTPSRPLWVNIALSWMRSLMHTASSGKTACASTRHLGLRLCVHLCVRPRLCVCVCVCVHVLFVCFSACSSRRAYVCLIVCVCVSGCVPTAAPVGHLSSQSYQQGSCNLAANLIIQIAEYLMVLKRGVKKKQKKKT